MAAFTPDGFTAVTPYLVVADVEAELRFMRDAFGATEVFRLAGPNGAPMHVELKIGDARIMVGWAHDPGRATNGMVCVYVPDVDATFARAAAAAGATVAMPVADQFYGDRCGGVRSSNGVAWHIATHREDVRPEQMQERMAAAMRK